MFHVDINFDFMFLCTKDRLVLYDELSAHGYLPCPRNAVDNTVYLNDSLRFTHDKLPEIPSGECHNVASATPAERFASVTRSGGQVAQEKGNHTPVKLCIGPPRHVIPLVTQS